MDPGKPTESFHARLRGYLDRVDIYEHLLTTSTWHPSARDCESDQLDIAQLHHYLRPSEDDFADEVSAIVRKTAFLRKHAPRKPALIGEFGLATDKWGLSDYMKQDTEGIHVHNSLWASVFAGNSGTAMFWWWDQLDRQDAYRHYRALSLYLADVSFAGLTTVQTRVGADAVQVLGYRGDDRAYLWFFNSSATWWNLVAQKERPGMVYETTVELDGLVPGVYHVEWWGTREGKAIQTERIVAQEGTLRVTVPSFHGDIACKIRRP
jgi:hypothetical protein